MKEKTSKTKEKHAAREAVIIGQNLKHMRQRYGYSQQRIGHIIGVSFQQVQKYENGTNRLPVEKLHRLKELYGVPYSCFFEGLQTHDRKSDKQGNPDFMELNTRLLGMRNEKLQRKIYQIIAILIR